MTNLHATQCDICNKIALSIDKSDRSYASNVTINIPASLDDMFQRDFEFKGDICGECREELVNFIENYMENRKKTQ